MFHHTQRPPPPESPPHAPTERQNGRLPLHCLPFQSRRTIRNNSDIPAIRRGSTKPPTVAANRRFRSPKSVVTIPMQELYKTVRRQNLRGLRMSFHRRTPKNRSRRTVESPTIRTLSTPVTSVSRVSFRPTTRSGHRPPIGGRPISEESGPAQSQSGRPAHTESLPSAPAQPLARRRSTTARSH